MALIDRTHAIVVAVEQYSGLGAPWSLAGIAAQGADFARWLITRGVPAANIQVFATPGESSAFRLLGIPARRLADATSIEIEQFLVRIAEIWPEGEVLFLYWAGHGFIARDGGRRLIVGDATPALKKNIDLLQMLDILRSESSGAFNRQIGIIDACARFFEELQASTDLPPGGLPHARQRQGVQQFFYLAASSGEYATNNSFGPQVLQLLRELPEEDWPPAERKLRDRIEDVFRTLLAARQADQQPAWLEYRDGFDNVSTLGILPTLEDIHVLSVRAGFPLNRLRMLAELVARCPSMQNPEGRDALYNAIRSEIPLANRTHSRTNSCLDLMRIIAGAIEQRAAAHLSTALVRLESNSDEAFRFRQAARSVDLVQGFWPLLEKLRLRLPRARVLYRASRPLRIGESDPGSLEEIVDRLLDSGDPPEALMEFLLRAAKERSDDPDCVQLSQWIAGRVNEAPLVSRIQARLDKESCGRAWLLVAVGNVCGSFRVTKAWLWPASADAPEELERVEGAGDLAGDIAQLLDEAEGEAGKVFLEILAPEELLHLDRGKLALRLRDQVLDPENSHPVALRWLDRMEAPPRDRSYLPGRWRNAASKIRDRLNAAARSYWLKVDDNPEEFRARFLNGETGELIGIPLSSDSESRSRIVSLICSGGLPYACWLRCSGVDMNEAMRSVQELIDECAFDEVSDGLLRRRLANPVPLRDVLLLWDDPRRNPYDFKYSEVVQKG